jgi:hypothetical protein
MVHMDSIQCCTTQLLGERHAGLEDWTAGRVRAPSRPMDPAAELVSCSVSRQRCLDATSDSKR